MINAAKLFFTADLPYRCAQMNMLAVLSSGLIFDCGFTLYILRPSSRFQGKLNDIFIY